MTRFGTDGKAAKAAAAEQAAAFRARKKHEEFLNEVFCHKPHTDRAKRRLAFRHATATRFVTVLI